MRPLNIPWRRLPVVLSTLAAMAAPALAAETRPVVELFTGQGCSSCPAADRILGELAREGRVIALSVPVDYWDYLGWKDTLAQHAHSLRQRGYAGGRGDRQVYTPQVVVNGAAQVIGSDRTAIDAACKQAAPSLPVSLARKGDAIEIDVGPGQGAPATVWLLTVARATPVAIGRGENQGRTITYSNVVRSWQRV